MTTTTMFGGFKHVNTSPTLENAIYTAIFGGLEIDLTQVELEPGEHKIDATAIVGGINITAPKDVGISVSGYIFMGGVEDEDKTVDYASAERRIKINAICCLGGIVIERV